MPLGENMRKTSKIKLAILIAAGVLLLPALVMFSATIFYLDQGPVVLIGPPEPFDTSTPKVFANTTTIAVNAQNVIRSGETTFDSVDAAALHVQDGSLGSAQDSNVVLFLSEDASHSVFIQLKDALDARGYTTKVAIISDKGDAP